MPEYLLGDMGRIQQILINLISNAIKYTDEGKITLSVAWAPQDMDKGVLRIKVIDTGIGLERIPWPINGTATSYMDTFKHSFEITAKKLGINVADSFIVNLGAGEDENVLLASKRYDRSFEGSVKKINGLNCPLRLHQEDFAQALGISSANKYEHSGDKYLVKIFDLLRKHSANPLEDRIELWRRIVFNYLVGNTDGHIKNFSLLYSSDLKSIRLAPAYDLVSTTVYKQGTRSMSIAFC